MKNIIIIKLYNNLGGGNIVLDRLSEKYSSITLLKNQKKLLNIFIIIYKLLYLKLVYSKNKFIFLSSDPIICILLFFSRIKFIRFVQADDLIILKDRIPNFFFYFYKYIYKISFSQKYFVNSFFVKNLMKKRYNKQNNYLGIVHPGSNFKLNINIKKEFFLIYILRKAPWKGKDFFLKIINKNILLDKNVLIIDVDNLIHENFSSNFTIIKKIQPKEIEHYYHKSFFYLSTSENEGFGLPGLEAITCGCMPIMPKHGGHLDYIKSNNSITYNLKDEQSFNNAIIHAETLIKNKSKIEQFQNECIKISNKFNWDNTTRMFDLLLKNNGYKR